jgi:preprotein translocase subunit SecD
MPTDLPPPYGPRKSNTGIIVVITLATVVAVALVTAAFVLTPWKHDSPARAARPLLIQQVTASAAGGCAGGSGSSTGQGVPALDGTACYQLASGLTITEFEKVDLVAPGKGPSWGILLTLRPTDAVAFGRLTTQVYREAEPRNQLALVIDGKVVSVPTVREPISGGKVQIEGRFSKDAASHIVDQLKGSG